MSHDAIWDEAYYKQTKNPRFIKVHEALKLRDSNTLKSGDLYCCNGNCDVRLGVRRPFTRRTSSGFTNVRGCFRRLPGARVTKSTRKECIKHSVARSKGETWKHARVLSVIKSFLIENKSDYGVKKVEELSGYSSKIETDDEADLLIHHSKEINGEKKIRLICRFYNMRRANKVIKKHHPGIMFIDMHRWRDKDIDFVEYIHSMIKNEYQRIQNLTTESSYSDLIHEIQYKYPNLGFHSDGGLGFGLKGTISLSANSSSDLDDEQFNHIHTKFKNLLKAVEEHNYWSITNPGCQKYHLKNLGFGNYTHFTHFIPGISSSEEEIEPFPKAISIMMQENYLNHVGNTSLLFLVKRKISGDSVSDEEEESAHFLGTARGLLEGDGQIGYANLSDGPNPHKIQIGAHESIFIISSPGPDYPFTTALDGWEDTVTNYLKDMKKTIDNFRKNNYDSWLCKYAGPDTGKYHFKDLPPKELPYEVTNLKENDSWYMQQAYHTAIPDLMFWNSFNDKQKKIVFKQVKKLYRKLSVYRGRIIVMPLIDIILDQIPQTMVDPNKIFEYISKPLEEPKSGNPLQPGDYMFLKWTMLAEKFYPQVNAPIIKEIIHAVSFSTEELVEEVSIELPIFLQGKLGEQGNIGEEIIDHLLSRFSEEE